MFPPTNFQFETNSLFSLLCPNCLYYFLVREGCVIMMFYVPQEPKSGKGPYFNYVSTFLSIFDQLSTLVSIFTTVPGNSYTTAVSILQTK